MLFEAMRDCLPDFVVPAGCQRNRARPSAAQRDSQQTGSARQREHFGQPWNERLPRRLMQAVLHCVPQEFVAAVLKC